MFAAAGTLCACSHGGVRPREKPARGVWSRPMTLAHCSAPGAPRVVFPQKTPFRRTGQGAIVFAGAQSCRGGSSALIAPIGPGDVPERPRAPRTASGGAVTLTPPFAGAATTDGRIVLVGASPRRSRGRGSAMLSEGRAGGAFTAPRSLAGRSSPLGLATAYLGDVAIASERDDRSLGVEIRMQRWFAHGFGEATRLGGRSGARRALEVALDYRTDAIAVWWQDGWLWARERHVNGALGPLQRFARAGPKVQLSALCSDDGRAIVAWIDPSGGRAKLYIDVSAPFMRLGPGRLLERLRWRGGATLPASGSVRLVRLSTESVLMAWTATQNGHFVVRAAGIDLQGPRTISTVSAPGEDATLLDLATGPRGDALAVWRGAPAGAAARDGGRAALMAARGVPSSRGVPRFDAPQRLAPPGRYGDAGVALDPGSDRAVASWREQGGAIRWAVRSVGR
jgi:hypothetical protein